MSGNPIKDKNALVNGKVWVLLTYSDGSQFCFQTTLNTHILKELGIILEEGKLPRIDKKYYWGGQYVYRQFSFIGAKLSLWDNLTYTHKPSEVLHSFF